MLTLFDDVCMVLGSIPSQLDCYVVWWCLYCSKLHS